MEELAELSPITKKLRKLLNKHGLSQAELSRQTSIPTATIGHITDGTTYNPRMETLIQLAKHFKISLDELTGIKIKEQPPKIITKLVSKELKAKNIPLLSWNDIIFWYSQREAFLPSDHKDWVLYSSSIPEGAFALKLSYEGTGVFPAGSVIIVDIKRKYKIGDYVIASIGGKKSTIKKVHEDSETLYLNPVGVNINSEKIEPPNQVIGTIVEYKLATVK